MSATADDQAVLRKAIVAIMLDNSLSEQEKALKRQALLSGKWAPTQAGGGAFLCHRRKGSTGRMRGALAAFATRHSTGRVVTDRAVHARGRERRGMDAGRASAGTVGRDRRAPHRAYLPVPRPAGVTALAPPRAEGGARLCAHAHNVRPPGSIGRLRAAPDLPDPSLTLIPSPSATTEKCSAGRQSCRSRRAGSCCAGGQGGRRARRHGRAGWVHHAGRHAQVRHVHGAVRAARDGNEKNSIKTWGQF